MVSYQRQDEELREPMPSSFGGVLRRTVGSVRAMINSRLELIVCEFREEKARLASLLIFGLGAVFLCFLGLMSATAAVAVYFADNAFAVLLGFTAFYLLAAIGFLIGVRKRIKAPLFPETVSQLKKDREELFE